MARTKTKGSKKGVKKSTSNKPKTSDHQTGSNSAPRPAGKRLTMKQIKERAMIIKKAVEKANKEHELEKAKYLEGKILNKPKVKFNSLVKFSSGQEEIRTFIDGESAKIYKNLWIQPEEEEEVKNKRVTRRSSKPTSSNGK